MPPCAFGEEPLPSHGHRLVLVHSCYSYAFALARRLRAIQGISIRSNRASYLVLLLSLLSGLHLENSALTLRCDGAETTPGTVFLVIGSDTAIWDGLDLTRYRCHFTPDLYVATNRNAYGVMDPAFRNRFTDSFGTPLKMTWWSLVGGINRPSDNHDAPIAGLMPLYLLKKYHGDRMREFGDEQAMHYHTFFWSDYDHDGKYWWNESKTFAECAEDFEVALAQSFLEEDLFPVSFRSGWHYMDNTWQARINELFPFSLHCASPIHLTDTVEPLENNYDWSQGTLRFIPFHPATTNYQVAGDGPGWNVRSIKMPSMTQKIMDSMFAEAANGTNQVACLWAHLPEAPFLTDIARMDLLAHVAETNHPGVRFRYCTAVEAMQRWMNTEDHQPPALEVHTSEEGTAVTLTIQVDEPIFQPQPVIALKDVCGHYSLLKPETVDTLHWKLLLPVPKDQIVKFGVAVIDLAGNLATKTIRYLPDDLYVDNLDSGYTETLGTWSSRPEFSWGTDSRATELTAGVPVEAHWTLPIEATGNYSVWVQIPAATNPAPSTRYELQAGGSTIFSRVFDSHLPFKTWILLGNAALQAGQDVALSLHADPEGQEGKTVLADVVKLTPLTPQDDFISSLQIDSGLDSATLLWTTPEPSTDWVEWGLSDTLGTRSATNFTPTLQHVVTLVGLEPDQTYYFQINSSAQGRPHAFPCGMVGDHLPTLITKPHRRTEPVLEFTSVWKFTADNQDGVPWTQNDFQDTAWSEGPGLLWVDTRTEGPNPAVKNRNTEMPHNSKTDFPFPTYYCRTHFSVGDPSQLLSLTFTNYIDDGAVYFLNGVEVYRLNMPKAPTLITNSTLADAYSCGGDAVCPVVFQLTTNANALAAVKEGDNLLAVEVHNYSAKSTDVTFGATVIAEYALETPLVMHSLATSSGFFLYWNGGNAVLQTSDSLAADALWTDVESSANRSPYYRPYETLSDRSRFFRLRPSL